MIMAVALKPWPRGGRLREKQRYHLPRLLDLRPCPPTSVTEEFGWNARACLRRFSNMPLTEVVSGSGMRGSTGQLAKPWFGAKLRPGRCSVWCCGGPQSVIASYVHTAAIIIVRFSTSTCGAVMAVKRGINRSPSLTRYSSADCNRMKTLLKASLG